MASPDVPSFISAIQTSTPGNPLSLEYKKIISIINTSTTTLDASYIDLTVACESEAASLDRKIAGVAYVA